MSNQKFPLLSEIRFESEKSNSGESGQKMEGTFSSLLEHNEPRPRKNGH